MNTRATVSLVAIGAVVATFLPFCAVAQTINIDSASPTNSGTTNLLRFNITGAGSGPVVIQRANVANDPWCSIATVVERSNLLVSADGPQAFFRVRDLSNAAPTRLTVSLSGAAAGTGSTGDGFGTFDLVGDTLNFDVAYRGLSSGTMMAHIHGPATSAGSAGFFVDFAPHFVTGLTTNNGRIAGSVTLNAASKAAILGGRAYVNVHSTNFPGGEIRGQITPTTFRVVLNGTAERPATVTRGNGFGLMTVIGNQLSYHIAYQGLNSKATASHVHGPAPMNGSASVMYHLAAPAGFGTAGVLNGRTNLTAAQIAALVDGNAYVNIHTTNYPGGEIRGQVLPYIGEAPFAAELTGIAENPDVTTPANGFIGCTLQGNTLSFLMMYKDLKSPATASHIHGPAVTTNNTGVLYHLTSMHRGPLSTQGVFSGSVQLSTADVSNLLAGVLYVNIHTTNHVGGEIRGQLCPTILPVSLSPPAGVVSPATGYGYLGLVGKQFSMGVHYRDLVANASNAHLHGPAKPPASAGTLINLNTASYTAGGFGRSGFLIGSETTSDTIVSYIIDGLTYVNIHSSTFGGGEIRGDVLP